MHIFQTPKMHDNDTMAAIHGSRMSPQQQNDVRSTIIKRPFEPLAKPTVEPIHETFKYKKFDEKMDDDEFSDHDSHYSEDFEDCDFEFDAEQEKVPDITQRLLNFADMVNQDIKKFFGRKKDEESCDIYEDKWVTTKSGRELYYADLLRIAHGDTIELKTIKEMSLPTSPDNNNDTKYRYTGKMDVKAGLGPLNELFDLGLRKLNTKKVKRQKIEKKVDDSIPMQQRKLPDSFWREPGTNNDSRLNGTTALHSSHAPDFSDLLQSWSRGEEEEFSSSEMSIGSAESVIEQM